MNEFKFIKKGLTDLNVKTGSLASSLAVYHWDGVMSCISDPDGGAACLGDGAGEKKKLETDCR